MPSRVPSSSAAFIRLAATRASCATRFSRDSCADLAATTPSLGSRNAAAVGDFKNLSSSIASPSASMKTSIGALPSLSHDRASAPCARSAATQPASSAKAAA